MSWGRSRPHLRRLAPEQSEGKAKVATRGNSRGIGGCRFREPRSLPVSASENPANVLRDSRVRIALDPHCPPALLGAGLPS
mmetsp:Transcript_44203/g.133904  ORF Transcript_44203/g.133904 Transcript_44203/m.133904 type:complete len:81 (+) Transcript_44203:159-401(+)